MIMNEENAIMKGKVIQMFSAFIISFGYFLNSFSIVWPSYTLELLKSTQSPVGRITSTEGSMVASLPMLGVLTAIIVAGIISDKIGRKRTNILCGIGYVLAWFLKLSSTSITTIFIARFTIGFASGMHKIAALPFINELSHASIRGTTTTCVTFSYNFGILVSYLCGWKLGYDVIIYLAITLGSAFVMILCFLHESPVFLLQTGKEKKALKSLKFYRGTESVSDEIEYLKHQERTERAQEIAVSENIESDSLQLSHKNDKDIDAGMSAWNFLLRSKATQRALKTVTIHCILLVFGGTIAVEAYAAPLFKAAAPNMSAHACSVCLAMAFLFGSMLALVLNDIVGRRKLMISSSALGAWWLAVLATLLRWSWGPEWMIPGALLAFAVSFQAGFGIVPLIQLSECFVSKMKSLSMTISFVFMSMSNFVLLMVFDGMVVALGLDGTFVTFAAVCALTALVAAAIMHETKGVPIEDIVANYERGFLYRRNKYKTCRVKEIIRMLGEGNLLNEKYQSYI